MSKKIKALTIADNEDFLRQISKPVKLDDIHLESDIEDLIKLMLNSMI